MTVNEAAQQLAMDEAVDRAARAVSADLAVGWNDMDEQERGEARGIARVALIGSGLVERLAAVEALHTPVAGTLPDGTEVRNTVIAYCEDFDRCDGNDDQPCEASIDGAHEVDACNECRVLYEGEQGALFWPCPTIRALRGDT